MNANIISMALKSKYSAHIPPDQKPATSADALKRLLLGLGPRPKTRGAHGSFRKHNHVKGWKRPTQRQLKAQAASISAWNAATKTD